MIIYFLSTLLALAVYDLFVKLPVTKAWEKFKAKIEDRVP